MRIAYLAIYNSMHINIKVKYFENLSNAKLYFFAMQPSNIKPELLKEPICHNNLQIDTIIQEKCNVTECIKNCLKIRKIIKQNKIQLVHIIDMHFYMYALVLELLGIKVVIENNGTDVLIAPEKNPHIKKYYGAAYRLAKCVLQDSYVAKMKSISLGASRKNNFIIELGIDLSIFNLNVKKDVFRKKYGIDSDKKIVFSPRAFTNLYNISDIIKSIPLVSLAEPDVIYVFCTYVRNDRLTRLIRELELEDRVLFLGYLDNEKELPFLYADADVVVSIPSSDSSPRTVYEAMACGCPTIVSDLPWVRIRFPKTHELVKTPLKNVEALSNAIIGILSKKTEIDRNNSFQLIKKNLDFRVSARKLLYIYSKIIK